AIKAGQSSDHPGDQGSIEGLRAVVAQHCPKHPIAEAAVPVEMDPVARASIEGKRDAGSVALPDNGRLAELRSVEMLRPQQSFELFYSPVQRLAVQNGADLPPNRVFDLPKWQPGVTGDRQSGDSRRSALLNREQHVHAFRRRSQLRTDLGGVVAAPSVGLAHRTVGLLELLRVEFAAR